MAVTVGVNFLSVVHRRSGGVTIAFPDVCKTPAPPAPPVPVPYPNVARSADASGTAKRVKADGQPLCTKDSCFRRSTGDEAGTVGGVASGTVMGKARFVNYALDVQVEGKPVPRAFDLMLHNDRNTPPVPLTQGPVVAVAGLERPVCSICGKPL